jgi:hypothetical protein
MPRLTLLAKLARYSSAGCPPAGAAARDERQPRGGGFERRGAHLDDESSWTTYGPSWSTALRDRAATRPVFDVQSRIAGYSRQSATAHDERGAAALSLAATAGAPSFSGAGLSVIAATG